MKWPQIVMICLWSVSGFNGIVRNGEENVTRWWASLLAIGIEWFLLYKGGFFS